MACPPFQIARLPKIIFGEGELSRLGDEILTYGQHTLLVTGARFINSEVWKTLGRDLTAKGIAYEHISVADEPSPTLVDNAVAQFHGSTIDCVVGIGGGSPLDAAKAIAGLLPHGNSVMDHLEGVGKGLAYTGPSTPFIAVPTTAGTGSEATKNAVLSVRGTNGFKKSFRDEQLIARTAIVDPSLLLSCPHEIMSAQGMDAFTQLLESHVALNATPLTNTLAVAGMKAFHAGFFEALAKKTSAGLCHIAYASMTSGITLANAGLGVVHGLASPLGAFFPIPHGVVCGTLLAESVDINIAALNARDPENKALKRYAAVGEMLGSGMTLVERLREWTIRLNLPRLRDYGVTEDDFDRIIANCRGGSMKGNPVVLEDAEIAELLRRRL